MDVAKLILTATILFLQDRWIESPSRFTSKALKIYCFFFPQPPLQIEQNMPYKPLSSIFIFCHLQAAYEYKGHGHKELGMMGREPYGIIYGHKSHP